MDYQTLRGVMTALLLVLFIGVVWWAYGKRQQSRFEQAANSIFDDERGDASPRSQEPKL